MKDTQKRNQTDLKEQTKLTQQTELTNQTELTKQEEAIVDGFSQETVERIMTPKNDFVFKRLFGEGADTRNHGRK